MESDLSEIGERLSQYSREEAEFSAQRGVMDEMFPYIYQASKRMSCRAISRWLKDNHGIKLSAVTIAKALREPEQYWLQLYEQYEPAARLFAAAHGVTADVILQEEELFDHLRNENGLIEMTALDGPHAHEKYDEYQESAGVLDGWFSFDEDTRKTCLASIPADEPEEAEEHAKEKKEDDKDAK